MAPVKPTVPHPNANYPSQPHEAMQKLVTEKYDPGAANQVIDAWGALGTRFKELATDFSILVNGSQAAWTGRAAEGVRAALGKVGTFADTTGESFTRVSTAIEQQREAAVQANKSMPAPVEFNPLKIAGDWFANKGGAINPVMMVGAPIDMFMTHNKQQDAKEEAVRVMQTRDNTMMSAAMSMPTMESTPVVTQDQGVTQTSSTTSTSSLNSTNNVYRPPANTGMPTMPPPGTSNNNTNASWVAPQTNNSTTEPPRSPNLPPNNQNRPPIGPPGMLPPGMRPPGGGQPGRPGQGGPGMRPGGPGGGPGGAGGGRGMGPGGMAGMGGAGRGAGSFGPATPGGSAGVMGSGPGGAGAGGAGAGRAGAAGAAGMGAGGAGAGQGGQGGDDTEHKSNYLLPTDEFFDDDRMVAPPVIGG